MSDYLDEFFGPEGVLARKFRGAENRPQQHDMARAVDAALREDRPLDVEAPCGVGKTFAYLVPLLRHVKENRSRAVVCTANIALQEQIVGKDLPMLKRLLKGTWSYSMIKGINNYLCLDRYEDAMQEPGLFEDHGEATKSFRAWAQTTTTGDRSDLDVEPPRELWQRVSGVTDLCNGSQCRYYENCHAMRARRRLFATDLIITNYHLYFAHLAVKRDAGRDLVLPEHRYVVCDEGHEMADIARKFFGHRVTSRSVYFLFRGTKALGRKDLNDALAGTSRQLFENAAKRAGDAPFAVRLRGRPPPGIPEARKALAEYGRAMFAATKEATEPEALDRLSKCSNAASRMDQSLAVFEAPKEDDGLVRCVTREGDSTALEAMRLDVAPLMDELLYKEIGGVICTSATLTAGGSFAFLKSERGGAKAAELVVPSPFDFESQCLVWVPKIESKNPNDPSFRDELAEVIGTVLGWLGGRTMALFCSYKSLQHCADRAASLGVRVLKQGDKPRTKLLDEFRRRARNTALFATDSFWNGVDIPGDALTALVIDRIPFRPPDEPLTEAIQEGREDGFQSYALPRALLDLRQGVGRLIRTRTDRGIVVLCDPRVYTKGYGAAVRASLPQCRITREASEAKSFLEALHAGRS